MSAVDLTFRGENILAYESREREVLLAGPAGSGKSCVLLMKVLTLLGKYPGCRGLFCRGTRSSLTESGLVTWEQDVLGETHPVLLRNPNQRKVRQSYRFANGSELIVRGLDDPGKTLSSQYDFVYIQEATEEGVTLDVYETLLRALRNGKMVKDGKPWHQIMMDCNPTTPTHWLYKRQMAGTLRMYTSTHRDNPAYWDEETGDWTAAGYEYVEETLSRMTGTRRSRFYTGEWKRAVGAVYDGYVDADEPAGHLHPFGWRPEWHWRRVWGIDWGFTNPCCLVMGALDSDDRLHFYREYYATGTRAEVLARWAKCEVEEGREPMPVMIVCDHEPADVEEFKLYGPPGCPVQLADKGDRTGGIEIMQGYFDFRGDGKPRIYFTRGMLAHPPDPVLEGEGKPTCALEEILGYKWDRSASAERNDKDIPVDKDNHACDAMRYVCKWVAKYTQKAPPRTRPRTPADPFGRLPRNTWS